MTRRTFSLQMHDRPGPLPCPTCGYPTRPAAEPRWQICDHCMGLGKSFQKRAAACELAADRPECLCGRPKSDHGGPYRLGAIFTHDFVAKMAMPK